MSGLAAADVARSHKDRGQAPVWAMFIPSHVLRGGTIQAKTRKRLEAIMTKAREADLAALAEDIAENMKYILQCSSDEAFYALMKRSLRPDRRARVPHHHGRAGGVHLPQKGRSLRLQRNR
jgi:hypothetical protein